MALSTADKTAVFTTLQSMERAGRLTQGQAARWHGTKARKARAAGDSRTEIARLKAKVNRLVAAQDTALLHLTAAKAHTNGADIKKAQAKITRAIKTLAV